MRNIQKKTINFGFLGQIYANNIDNIDNINDEKSENNTHHFDIGELKLSLITATIKILSSYVDSSRLKKFDENCVCVSVVEGVISSTIHCILCDDIKTKKLCSVGKKIVKGKVYWMHANFYKHLEKVHELGIGGKKNKKVKMIPDNEIVGNIDNNEGLDFQKRLELIEKGLSESITNMIMDMAAACEHNQDTQDNVAFQSLQDCDAQMKVAQIQKDGNCLFGAAVHQLERTVIKSNAHYQKTSELRSNVVSFISENLSKFEHELKGRIDKVCTKTKSLKEQYEMFLENKLSRDGTWGGTESLKAIKLLHGVNILIINESGEYYFVDSYDDTFDLEKILILAFRVKSNIDKSLKNIKNGNRDHYDSVVYIEPADVLSISEELIRKMKNKRKMSSCIDLT